MKATEAAALLTVCAAYDNRKPDADQAKAWAMALDGWRFEDCRDAIVIHYRSSREWIMPADVIAGVKRIRSKRLHDHPPLTPPPHACETDDCTCVEFQRQWRIEADRRIGDGEVIDCDAAYGVLKSRHLPDLKALMPTVAVSHSVPTDGNDSNEQQTEETS